MNERLVIIVRQVFVSSLKWKILRDTKIITQ